MLRGGVFINKVRKPTRRRQPQVDTARQEEQQEEAVAEPPTKKAKTTQAVETPKPKKTKTKTKQKQKPPPKSLFGSLFASKAKQLGISEKATASKQAEPEPASVEDDNIDDDYDSPPPATEDDFKEWLKEKQKKGVVPTVSQAIRAFDGRASKTQVQNWYKANAKKDSILDEIIETSAKKKALAEKVYNHIDSWHVPNEYHQADLLFLPHDDADMREKEKHKKQTLEEALSGSGLFEHDTLPHHRRFVLSGGDVSDRPKRERKQTKRYADEQAAESKTKRSKKRKARAMDEEEDDDELVDDDAPKFTGIYKYCLSVVDVATRYKGAYPLKTKTAKEVFKGLQHIYNTTPLAWPSILHTDHGSEFSGLRKILMSKKYDIPTVVRLEIPFYHLPFVENFNQKLTEKIMRSQQEEELSTGLVSRKWVEQLPEYLDDLNQVPQKATGDLTPSVAMTKTWVPQQAPGPPNKNNPLFKDWRKLSSMHYEVGDHVRHYVPKDQYQETTKPFKIVKDKGTRRAGDPTWSVRKFKVIRIYKPHRYSSKSLWMHDIWPLDYPEPKKPTEEDDKELKETKLGKLGPDVRPSEHFGYTRSFTYFQLKKTK